MFFLALFTLTTITQTKSVEPTSNSAVQNVLRSTRCSSSIFIDGDLSDECWRGAHEATIGTQHYPEPGKPASFQSYVRVLYDDEALYIAAELRDPSPSKITAPITRRDREVESDWFRVEIDSRRDKKNGFLFAINPAGVKYDGKLFDENQSSSDWDGVWHGAAQITAQGWSAEIQIPLRLLRFQSGRKVSFNINFSRRISRLAEEDQWQFIPPESGQRVSRFGALCGLDLVRRPVDYQLTPYIAGKLEVDNGIVQDEPLQVFNVGADGKISLGSNFMLTLTANPDFGQVEADQMVFNLSTIETYFPEKRPFFLEDMDLFKLPHFGDGSPTADLFYTRRVGRAPRDPNLEDDEALITPAAFPRILGAIKLAGSTDGRLSLGLLQAITSEQSAFVERRDGKTEPRIAEPLTSFSILRLKQHLGASSSVGMMATATGTKDQGAAVSGGTDFIFDLLDGHYNVTLQSKFSYLSLKRFAWQDDYTRARLESQGPFGYSGELNLWKKSGDHLVGAVGASYRSPSLALNDLGYLDRPDLLFGFGWLQVRHLKPLGPFNQIYLNFNAWVYRNTDLVNIGDGWNVNGWFTLKNNWELGFNLSFNPAHCDDRETRSAGEVLYYAEFFKFKQYAYLQTDKRRALSASLELTHQNTERGNNIEMMLPILISPLSRLQIEITPRYNTTDGEVRWIDTFSVNNAASQYLFAERETETLDVMFRASYAFKPELTLQAYAQVLWAKVDHTQKLEGESSPMLSVNDLHPVNVVKDTYDFSSTQIVAGAVLRWEYLPGSVGYLVYSAQKENSLDFSAGAEAWEQRMLHSILLKLSYFFG